MMNLLLRICRKISTKSNTAHSRAAQPACVADAAARPQDRGVFERQMHTTVIPIYRAAQLTRIPLGRTVNAQAKDASTLLRGSYNGGYLRRLTSLRYM